MKLNEAVKTKNTPFSFRIEKLTGDLSYQERLYELGLHQGLGGEYIGQSPFSGPLILKFGSSMLALREEEASCIDITI